MKKINKEEAMELARKCSMQFVDLSTIEQIPEIVIELLPADVALDHSALPISKTGQTVTIAISDPHNTTKLEEIRQIILQFNGCEVIFYLASSEAIENALEKYYPDEQVEFHRAPTHKRLIR